MLARPILSKRRSGSVRTILLAAIEGLEGRLLFAQNITVAVGGTATLLQIDDSTFDNTANYIVAPSTLDTATSPVVMRATNSIIFSSPVSLANSGVGISATAEAGIVVGLGLSTNDGDITLAGTGTGGEGVSIGPGVAITSNGGQITLAGTGGGTFPTSHSPLGAVDVNDATLNAGGGNIKITGTSAATGSYLDGVQLSDGAAVETTGAGAITITGTGGSDPSGSGTTDGFDIGVRIASLGTEVSAAQGGITITGTGGDAGLSNSGVQILDEAVVSAAVTGNITLQGTGGGSSSYGVEVSGIGTQVTAPGPTGGTVTLTGTGGGTGSDAFGVIIEDGPEIDSGAGGVVIITGTGGGTGGDDFGVIVEDGPQVDSGAGGVVIITGTGGDGSGDDNDGVVITGTTGSGSSTLFGAGGNISLTGTGGGTGANEIGVNIAAYSTLSATMSGSVTLTGTGGSSGNSDNFGVYIDGSTAQVSAATGGITITGTGGGSGTNDGGVRLGDAATVSALTSGNVTINGTGSNSNGITVAGATLNAAAGNINLDPNTGIAVLTPDNTDTFTAMSTDLMTGTLQVDGSLLGSTTPIIVEARTTLDGLGTIAGPVNLQSGGTLAPGDPGGTGILDTASVTLVTGANLNFAVNGTTPGTQFSQLEVAGIMALGGATLNLSGTIAPSPGQTVMLIDNDGTGPVAGTFSGLAEGSPVSINGVAFRISYVGGSGNDVVLTQPIIPPTVGDSGFEQPSTADAPGNFIAGVTGTPWTFNGAAGISGNNGALTADSPNAPQGVQVGYLQIEGGVISQSLTFAAGTYQIQFFSLLESVPGHGGGRSYIVELDGTPQWTITPGTTAYATYTSTPFTVPAGIHTISFAGLGSHGGSDNTAFIDAVQVIVTTPTPTPIPTPAFTPLTTPTTPTPTPLTTSTTPALHAFK